MDFFRFFSPDAPPENEPTDDGVAIDLHALTEEDVPVVETAENSALLNALKEVIDPEVGVNIVDLGLVYVVERVGPRIDVVLTMTTAACPLSAVIEADVKEALLSTNPDIDEVRVAIIFHPPWSPKMMSDEARAQLGF